MEKLITVAEMFGPTIQGEGPLIGRPTLFVRTGGCDFVCSWCDSMHAVDRKKFGDKWFKLPASLIFDRLLGLSAGFPLLVSLSGGNPAIQPLGELLDLIREGGYESALETQGSIAQPWFAKLDWLILSPKGPTSGMPFNQVLLDRCVCSAGPETKVALKFVIFNDADYDFARGVCSPPFSDWQLPVYLSAGTDPAPGPGGQIEMPAHAAMRQNGMREQILRRTEWLVEKVSRDRWFGVTVLPQLHALIWGDEKER